MEQRNKQLEGNNLLTIWYQVCNNPEFQGFLVKLEWRLIQGFLLLLKSKALSLSMGSAGFREGGSCSNIHCWQRRKALEGMVVPTFPLEVMAQMFCGGSAWSPGPSCTSLRPRRERQSHPVGHCSVREEPRGSGTLAPGHPQRGEGCEDS